MNSKFLIIGISVVVFIALLTWLFIESSKPLPGQKMEDQGRGHVPVGEKVEYNSNPPTSGKHYEEWTRAGVYEDIKDDRNLVHSLEHGYIIMTYKCQLKNESGEATDSGQITDECKTRKDQLAQIYEKKGKRKLIVVPRANLETNFALTAWDYIDKFDQFDEERIVKFIEAHFDMGPEKTME